MTCPHGGGGACSCSGRGWWPTNLRKVTTTIFGVPAIVRGYIGAIDAAQSHGLAGRSGAKRMGDSASIPYHFAGYLAYAATANIPTGSSSNLRRSPYTLLPDTSGDVRTVAGGSVQAALAASMPGGWRR